MSKIIKSYHVIIIFATVSLLSSCKKYLDEKTNKKFVVPENILDGQALIDYYFNINYKDAGAGEASTDNFYLSDDTYTSLASEYYRRMYVWEKDRLFAPTFNDWNNLYSNVYVANTVLELLEKIDRTESNLSQWDNLKGQTLFLRGRSFYQVTSIWSNGYDSATADTDMGIPLRLNTNFNESSVRASNQQTYNQILTDLKQAANLLPISPLHPMRASRTAAYACIARTYMSARNYDSCLQYCEMTLQLKDTLLDYNNPLINPDAFFPFSTFQYNNPEIIFESRFQLPLSINPNFARVDSNLFRSYEPDDLRKKIFFRINTDGSYRFKGSYEGSVTLFSGIATDEVYLMKAECLARKGQINLAMQYLNMLMKKRWNKNVVYNPITAVDSKEALSKILTERRKELLMRGLRWVDLKRLNKEGANITLIRVIKGQSYLLSPNDLRYTLPIPEDIIETSGISQNPK